MGQKLNTSSFGREVTVSFRGHRAEMFLKTSSMFRQERAVFVFPH
jgi:hypothetical protein